MIRLLAAAVHIVFAMLFAFASAWILVQGRLNAAWELGFYGQLSPGTLAAYLGAIFTIGFASFETLTALGFAFRRRWGSAGMLCTSALLGVAYPFPLNAVMASTGLLALSDLVPWHLLQSSDDEE